ncbi:hypothetical protein EYR36_009950 [Pleurotus pulmonarius]|nr:hypothetical protein EYR36_009950 [Pleurotus pulmonarius]KAF4593427.1 hypothetical protein EYR38_009141 [Pleurotus pulmonarius]
MDRQPINSFNERAEREIRGPVASPQIRERVVEFPQPPRDGSFAPQDTHVPSHHISIESDAFVYQHRLLEPIDIPVLGGPVPEAAESPYEHRTWSPPRSYSRFPTSSVRTGSMPDEDVSYERGAEARMREVFANERIFDPGNVKKPRSFSDSADLFAMASAQRTSAHPIAVALSTAGPSTQSRNDRDTVARITWSTRRSANAVQSYSASKEEASLLLLLAGGNPKAILLEDGDDTADDDQLTEDAMQGVVVEGVRLIRGPPKATSGKGKARETKPRGVENQKDTIEKTDGKRPVTRSAKGKGKAKDAEKGTEVKKVQTTKPKIQPKTNKRKASSLSDSVTVDEEAPPPAKRIRFESETSAGSQDGPKLFIALPSKARLEEMLRRQPIWEVATASSSTSTGGTNEQNPRLSKRPRSAASRSTRKH